MTNNIAITGSSGYCGSLLKRILNTPDNLSFDTAKGDDLTTETSLSSITQRASVIIHLAAISGIEACNNNQTEASRINTEATIRLAEMMRDTGASRLIFSSSSAVYGEAQAYNLDELAETSPRTFYGKSKLMAERIMEYASPTFQIVILRPSNIYGYGLIWKEKTVISKFITAVIENKPIEITGSGSQKRDFVHVMDIVRLYARIATAPSVRSGIYNIGGNETISMRALAEMVNDVGEVVLGYRVPVIYKPDINETMYHDFRYNSDKAKHVFQYEPKFSVRDAIKERFMMHLRR